jgi:hypothetical protein
VLEHIGISTWHMTPLADLQKLLAEKISPEDLDRFCGPGGWKCEFYAMGLCQRGYGKLRERYGIQSSG